MSGPNSISGNTVEMIGAFPDGEPRIEREFVREKQSSEWRYVVGDIYDMQAEAQKMTGSLALKVVLTREGNGFFMLAKPGNALFPGAPVFGRASSRDVAGQGRLYEIVSFQSGSELQVLAEDLLLDAERDSDRAA